MKKNTNYAKNNNAKNAFEEKYGDIILTLSKMPCVTDEDKQARWRYFKQNQTDDFLISLFKAVKPYEAGLVDKCYDNVGELLPEKTVNALHVFECFIQGLPNQVMNFTGTNHSGKQYDFFQAMGSEIRHLKSKENPNNQIIQEQGRISSNRQQRIRKMAKMLEEIQKILGIHTYDDFMNKAMELNISEFDGQLLKDDCSFAVEYALKIGRFAEKTSLDTPAGEEADVKLADIIPSKRDSFENPFEIQELKGHYLISLLTDRERVEFLLDTKNDLFKGIHRPDWEWILWFTQVNMLIALKLEKCDNYKTTENGKVIPQERFNKIEGNNLFYYRYVDEPAGDEEVYLSMEPSGDVIYKNILDKRYLMKAFSEKRFPADFYDVYNKLLEDSFNFSNKIQAECLGKSESLISRKMTRYRKILSPQLEKWLELL